MRVGMRRAVRALAITAALAGLIGVAVVSFPSSVGADTTVTGTIQRWSPGTSIGVTSLEWLVQQHCQSGRLPPNTQGHDAFVVKAPNVRTVSVAGSAVTPYNLELAFFDRACNVVPATFDRAPADHYNIRPDGGKHAEWVLLWSGSGVDIDFTLAWSTSETAVFPATTTTAPLVNTSITTTSTLVPKVSTTVPEPIDEIVPNTTSTTTPTEGFGAGNGRLISAEVNNGVSGGITRSEFTLPHNECTGLPVTQGVDAFVFRGPMDRLSVVGQAQSAHQLAVHFYAENCDFLGTSASASDGDVRNAQPDADGQIANGIQPTTAGWAVVTTSAATNVTLSATWARGALPAPDPTTTTSTTLVKDPTATPRPQRQGQATGHILRSETQFLAQNLGAPPWGGVTASEFTLRACFAPSLPTTNGVDAWVLEVRDAKVVTVVGQSEGEYDLEVQFYGNSCSENGGRFQGDPDLVNVKPHKPARWIMVLGTGGADIDLTITWSADADTAATPETTTTTFIGGVETPSTTLPREADEALNHTLQTVATAPQTASTAVTSSTSSTTPPSSTSTTALRRNSTTTTQAGAPGEQQDDESLSELVTDSDAPLPVSDVNVGAPGVTGAAARGGGVASRGSVAPDGLATSDADADPGTIVLGAVSAPPVLPAYLTGERAEQATGLDQGEIAAVVTAGPAGAFVVISLPFILALGAGVVVGRRRVARIIATKRALA